MLSRSLRLLGIGVLLATAACSSESSAPAKTTDTNTSTNSTEGRVTAQKLLGSSANNARSAADEADTRKAVAEVDPAVMQTEIQSLYTIDPNDPLAKIAVPHATPSVAEVQAATAAFASAPVPSAADRERFLAAAYDEIDRLAPGYFATFATDMKSSDINVTSNAVKRFRRTLVVVATSRELSAKLQVSGGDIGILNTGATTSSGGEPGTGSDRIDDATAAELQKTLGIDSQFNPKNMILASAQGEAVAGVFDLGSQIISAPLMLKWMGQIPAGDIQAITKQLEEKGMAEDIEDWKSGLHRYGRETDGGYYHSPQLPDRSCGSPYCD